MEAKSSPPKRSPLKAKPLRNAGDSVQEELDRVVDGELLSALLVAALGVMIAVYEWWRFLTSSPPQPVAITIVAIGSVGFAAYRFVTLQKKMARLRLGRDGEKTVAQYLEANRQPDWRIFNDIPGDGFNVDHILVTPQGVFVLETKAFSKPTGRRAEVTYDGAKVIVDGRSPGRDPVEQVRAIGNWVRKSLSGATAMEVPVRGVVLFPGWWVIQSPKNGPKPAVWVLNHEALPQFIQHEPVVLKKEQVAFLGTVVAERLTRE